MVVMDGLAVEIVAVMDNSWPQRRKRKDRIFGGMKKKAETTHGSSR